MNSNCIIAWVDDLQMSAHLAKISTIHSYRLIFWENFEKINQGSEYILFIIDLNNI